eukprot:2149950-Alexandrium_andersonii.AAC.1
MTAPRIKGRAPEALRVVQYVGLPRQNLQSAVSSSDSRLGIGREPALAATVLKPPVADSMGRNQNESNGGTSLEHNLEV